MTREQRQTARKHGVALRDERHPERGWRTFPVPTTQGGRKAPELVRPGNDHGPIDKNRISEAAAQRASDDRERISDELADVMIQVLNFADVTGIDVIAAMARKIEANEAKYPVERSRGSSAKYTDL